MKKEDNKIIFIDDKGQKTTLNILFTYKNDKRNREYVLFYDLKIISRRTRKLIFTIIFINLCYNIKD